MSDDDQVVKRTTSGAAQRACDDCRARKIRCDRGSPCSHCKSAGIACRTTTSKAAGEKKDRVQVSKQYENKIDRIESRLASIEQLLRQSNSTKALDHTVQSGTTSTTTSPNWNSSAPYTPNIDSSNLQVNEPTSLKHPQEDTGLQADSTAAKVVLEESLERDPTISHDPQVGNALKTLRKLVSCAHIDISTKADNLGPTSGTISGNGSERPSWDQVRPVIERVEREKPAAFSWMPTIWDDLCKKTRSMYTRPEPVTTIDQVFVYSCMSNTCSEFSSMDFGEAAETNYQLSAVFSSLMLKTLKTVSLLIPASLEAAEALLVAATTTVGMCKPSLSWDLICATAHMCQNLGYNRLARIKPSPDPLYDRKTILFWSVYAMERSMAIRLGRTPVIQDYGIDTPMIKPSEEIPATAIAMMRFWVDCGKIQGKICAQLYGPSVPAMGLEERARTAEGFVDQLETIRQDRIVESGNITSLSSDPRGNQGTDLLLQGEDIILYSTITVALYAIPTRHPRHCRALEAARKCLSINRAISRNCVDNVYAWTTYCHWVLMHTPLTPFTSVFCNIITHPEDSHSDLSLLEDFVSSLQSGRRLSQGIEKYFQLCSVFVQVAQAYVRAKKTQLGLTGHNQTTLQETARDLQPAISEFDQHLSSLGFFGQQAGGAQVDACGLGGGGEEEGFWGTEQQQQALLVDPGLLDWYSGNVSLYGLLEQDFY